MRQSVFKISFFIVAVTSALVLFQNCTPRTQFSDAEKGSLQAADSGWPHEGKVYVSVENCAGETEPVAKIKLVTNGTSLLVKEACQILPTPTPVAETDLILDPATPEELLYQGRAFVLEPDTPNPAAFRQSSSQWNTTPALSFQGAPMSGATEAGDLVVCAVLYNSPTAVAEVSSITDNLGNVFRRGTQPTMAGRAQGFVGYTSEVWYAENSNAGVGLTPLVTFSENIPANQMINCYQYSGIETVNALDQAVSHADTADPDCNIQLGPVSTNWSNELVFVATFGPITSMGPDLTVRGSIADGASDRMISTPESLQLGLSCSSGASAAMLTFKARQ